MVAPGNSISELAVPVWVVMEYVVPVQKSVVGVVPEPLDETVQLIVPSAVVTELVVISSARWRLMRLPYGGK